MSGCVPLASAFEESRFGGKAASLQRAVSEGLPVPPGYGLDVTFVDAVAGGDPTQREQLAQVLEVLEGPLAVRSSAVGEDAKDASFAGQHLTLLNIRDLEALIGAIAEVHRSAHSASALAYRRRLGIDGVPRIGVVVQRLVEPVSAGVLFTRNPASGVAERVIEAAWGLGEAVVSGLVVPDAYRISAAGVVVETNIGVKDLALRTSSGGGTEEIAVDPALIHQAVLDTRALDELHALAIRCEGVYGQDLDIEWAFSRSALYLLQCRSITRAGP